MEFKTKMRKILSTILAFAIIVGMMPTTVFATEGATVGYRSVSSYGMTGSVELILPTGVTTKALILDDLLGITFKTASGENIATSASAIPASSTIFISFDLSKFTDDTYTATIPGELLTSDTDVSATLLENDKNSFIAERNLNIDKNSIVDYLETYYEYDESSGTGKLPSTFNYDAFLIELENIATNGADVYDGQLIYTPSTESAMGSLTGGLGICATGAGGKYTELRIHFNFTIDKLDSTQVDTYSVNYDSFTNGTVEAGKTTGIQENEEITLTVTPDTGYQLKAGSLAYYTTDVNTKTPITDNKFNMPAEDVTVVAEFEEVAVGSVVYNGINRVNITGTVKFTLPTGVTTKANIKDLSGITFKTESGENIATTVSANANSSTIFIVFDLSKFDNDIYTATIPAELLTSDIAVSATLSDASKIEFISGKYAIEDIASIVEYLTTNYRYNANSGTGTLPSTFDYDDFLTELKSNSKHGSNFMYSLNVQYIEPTTTSDGRLSGNLDMDGAVFENSSTYFVYIIKLDFTIDKLDSTQVDTYSVNYDSFTNGSVTASKITEIKENDEITLTVTPDTGYQLKAGSLAYYTTDVNTKTPITDNKFNMPAGDVTVVAEFEEVPVGTLSGTATITGEVKFDETLSADTSGITNNTGAFSYQWKRGTTNIGTNSSTYTLVEADIGEIITVEITSSVQSGTITSSATLTVEKADGPAAPMPPSMLGIPTTNSITMIVVSGQEYSIDNGVSWQETDTFTGLDSGTYYRITTRIKETATHKASANSPSLHTPTLKEALTGSLVILNADDGVTVGEQLTASYTGTGTGTYSYQWRLDEADIDGATNSTYIPTEDDVGKVIAVLFTTSGTSGSILSEKYTVEKIDGALAPDAPTVSSKTYNSITVVAVAGQEYRIGTGVWQDSGIFGSLSENTNYNIYTRIKETATTKASSVSLALSVTTNEKPTNSLEGTATITGDVKFDETLSAELKGGNSTNLTYVWKADGTVINGATNSSYKLTENEIGDKITVEISATDMLGTITSSETLQVEKADATTKPNGLNSVAPTISLNDGKITGVTTDMEYADNNLFTNVKTITGTEITGLTAGTYYVRFKETATHNASDYTEVVVSSFNYVDVTGITLATNSVTVNSDLTLTGTIAPSTATYKDITWTVKDANGTGANINNNTFTATIAGTATITATVVNGDTNGTADYTQDFTITVIENNEGSGTGTGSTTTATDTTTTNTNTTYSVAVTYGSGDGSYKAGDWVTISAENRSGFVFSHWSSGDVSFENANSTTTRFIMNSKNVVVTAIYSAVVGTGTTVQTDEIEDIEVPQAAQPEVSTEEISPVEPPLAAENTEASTNSGNSILPILGLGAVLAIVAGFIIIKRREVE